MSPEPGMICYQREQLELAAQVHVAAGQADEDRPGPEPVQRGQFHWMPTVPLGVRGPLAAILLAS